MILVSLGTQDKEFSRLLLMIQKLVDENLIKEKVIVQAGYTKFKTDTMEVFDYVSMDKFSELLDECDLLITHGGVGTIMSALKLKKPVIACARLAKFHEHHNDHQCEIIEAFEKQGYLIKCDEEHSLKECLQQAKEFRSKEIISNNSNFISILKEYIGE